MTVDAANDIYGDGCLLHDDKRQNSEEQQLKHSKMFKNNHVQGHDLSFGQPSASGLCSAMLVGQISAKRALLGCSWWSILLVAHNGGISHRISGISIGPTELTTESCVRDRQPASA